MIKKWTKKLKLDKGFTLIEMSLVLFVISFLLILFIPNLSGRQDNAAATGKDAMETVLITQIDLYKMDNNNKAPESLATLKQGNYLTEKQLNRANDLFNYSEGVLTDKK
ncbi:competence type IV pilus major pilin ComGC [Alkalibacterium sp.]|nr:MAG: prepilin-type N-terminal cleavage/methylation domain-containing protein [Alkalibacterium sp.]